MANDTMRDFGVVYYQLASYLKGIYENRDRVSCGP